MYKRCSCERQRKKPFKHISDNRFKKIEKELLFIGVASRLRILYILKASPHCVCDLMSHTGLSQSLISHHLADLKQTGFVEKKKNGRFVDYHLTEKGGKTMDILKRFITNKL